LTSCFSIQPSYKILNWPWHLTLSFLCRRPLFWGWYQCQQTSTCVWLCHWINWHTC
jgi:hypothetical protein